MPKSTPDLIFHQTEYINFVQELKAKVQSAQIRASFAVNRELISLYWAIGRDIFQKQQQFGWGKSIVEKISSELQAQLPGIKGFSIQNMWHMRAFYLAWRQEKKLPQVVGEIPWGHNIVLFEKIKDPSERSWYAGQIVENGWSRAVLVHQIESHLYERQRGGRKLTNFEQTLPPPQSDLARELIKDPYHLGFLAVDDQIREKTLQKSLVSRLKDLLVELGAGFAFVGSEYHLEVGGQDFYIDLLFYHLRLRCYVVIELKTVAFQPEFAGKMNFYLSAVDDLMAHPNDNPSIGILLCKNRNKTIVEYALRDSRKPIGVSSYRLTQTLPKNLAGQLPSAKQLSKIDS